MGLQLSLAAARLAPIVTTAGFIAQRLIPSGVLYPQSIQRLQQSGQLLLNDSRVQQGIQTVISRANPTAISAWTRGINGAKSHYFIRVFEMPDRFSNIATRLGQPWFRYSAKEFERFTNLAKEIASTPQGQSAYGEVFKRSTQDVITFVRTSGGSGPVQSSDLGVMVIRNANGLIKTFRDATGQQFITGQ